MVLAEGIVLSGRQTVIRGSHFTGKPPVRSGWTDV